MAAPDTSTSTAPSTFESFNPATGEPIGQLPIHSPDDVHAAVDRARAAAATWSGMSFADRGEQLTRWRRALAARADELADLIHRENGKPMIDALLEIMMSLSHLAHASKRAEPALKSRRVSAGLMANYRAVISYHPLGVIGVIGPWNYPMFTPMGSIAYALAAGNTVVFKPSELTPLVGQAMAEIAAESMSLANVLQVVTGAGETGAALARAKVDKIAFTGSARTGSRVMAAAAENLTPVLMELGGKDAMVVAEDADLDKAAQAAVYGALTNAGQACISVERAYVARPVYKEFLTKVLDQARSVTVGGPDADIGAITRPQQVELIRDHLRDAVDKGATALVGGPDAIDGNFVQPTVLVDVTADMRLMREETFGPVLPIIQVDSAEEGVRLANQTTFGLGSSIFGRARVRQLADKIRAGMTSINAVLAYSAIPSLPFGGVGESGFGRIHGDEGLREFARIKSTAEERFSTPLNLLSFNLPDNTYSKVRGMIDRIYGGGVIDQMLDRASSVLNKLR